MSEDDVKVVFESFGEFDFIFMIKDDDLGVVGKFVSVFV